MEAAEHPSSAGNGGRREVGPVSPLHKLILRWPNPSWSSLHQGLLGCVCSGCRRSTTLQVTLFDELSECPRAGINGDKRSAMPRSDLRCDDDTDNMKETEESWDMNHSLAWYASSSYSFILCRILDVRLESLRGTASQLKDTGGERLSKTTHFRVSVLLFVLSDVPEISFACTRICWSQACGKL